MSEGPGRSTNEDTWDMMIYDLPVFKESDPADKHVVAAWKWAEELRRSKKLRQTDMIALGALLQAVYEVGVKQGREENE